MLLTADISRRSRNGARDDFEIGEQTAGMARSAQERVGPERWLAFARQGCSTPGRWPDDQYLGEKNNHEHQEQTAKSMPKTDRMARQIPFVDNEHSALQSDRLGINAYLDRQARHDSRRGLRWREDRSQAGLMGFVNLLVDYARKDSNLRIGEHDHFGPHMYLTVQTAEEADITGRAIYARLEGIARLAGLLRARLQLANSGEQVTIGQEYASTAEYSVVLEVREEGFDPSSLDPQL